MTLCNRSLIVRNPNDLLSFSPQFYEDCPFGFLSVSCSVVPLSQLQQAAVFTGEAQINPQYVVCSAGGKQSWYDDISVCHLI